jgi:hypothetical protein
VADKLPFMPFYGSDFYEDEAVCLMNAEEERVYLRLLWRQWREGSLPAESDELQALLRGLPGLSPRVLACIPRCDDGRRRNPRLEEHRQKHLRILEKKSQGGRAGRAKQLKTNRVRGVPGESLGTPRGIARGKLGESESDTDSKKTWLTLFADAWQARCGNPPHGRLAKALAPLVQQLGGPEALERWSRYLAGNEPRYCSPERFAATHQQYAGPETQEMTDEFGQMRLHRKNGDGKWEIVA